MYNSNKILAVFVFYLFVFQCKAIAASVPVNIDAGVINKSVQQEMQKDLINENKSDEAEIITPNKNDEKESSAVLKSPKFLLKGVNFSGNTIFSDEELQKFAQDVIGKNISVNEVLEVANKITDKYIEAGYLTSKAYLPPQKVAKGIVSIEILEGKIGNISVDGNKWVKANYLKKNVLASNKFEEGNIFNVRNLQNSLGAVNRKDHIKGKVVILDSDDPEYSDIILDIEDRIPLNFSVGYDNYGRNLIGLQRSSINLSYDNLTGYGDRLYTSSYFASRTFGVGAGYSIPIGVKGDELLFNYSYTDVRLGEPYEKDKIDGESHNYNVGFVHPLYRGDSINVDSTLSFDMINSDTISKLTSIVDTKYALRVLRAGIRAKKDDSAGRWISNISMSSGLPILGATRDIDKKQVSSRFIKFNTDIARLQSLPYNSLGIFKLAVQYSPYRLYAPEQFQVGGLNTVRGFEEGTLLGDSGFNTGLELRTPVPFLTKILPERFRHISDKLTMAYFYDFGFARDLYLDGSSHNTNFLQSVGVGFHIAINKYLNANFDIGIPISGKKVTGEFLPEGRSARDVQDVRLHFSLSSDIL